jgi:hypothetical protein
VIEYSCSILTTNLISVRSLCKSAELGRGLTVLSCSIHRGQPRLQTLPLESSMKRKIDQRREKLFELEQITRYIMSSTGASRRVSQRIADRTMSGVTVRLSPNPLWESDLKLISKFVSKRLRTVRKRGLQETTYRPVIIAMPLYV